MKTGVEIPILFPALGKPIKTKTKATEVEFTSEAFFQERPNDNLVSLCKDFLEAIKALVLEAESKGG